MVRGTNKRIIEISGEDGSCFERIVLFLRPEQAPGDEEKMVKMAEECAVGLMKTSTAPPELVTMTATLPSRRVNWRRVAMVALGVLAGCGALALCVAFL